MGHFKPKTGTRNEFPDPENPITLRFYAIGFILRSLKHFYIPLETVSPKLPHFVNLGVGQIVTATAQLLFNLEVCLTHQHVR